jgi:hypothetical protein
VLPSTAASRVEWRAVMRRELHLKEAVHAARRRGARVVANGGPVAARGLSAARCCGALPSAASGQASRRLGIVRCARRHAACAAVMRVTLRGKRRWF